MGQAPLVETVVGHFGLDEPVGEEIAYDSFDDDRYTIAGVLPDMRFGPMRQAIAPTVFRVSSTRKYVCGRTVSTRRKGLRSE